MFRKTKLPGNQPTAYNNGFPQPTGQNYQLDRMMYEVKENRRRINNLAKRIIRLENYLRIRDTSDYEIIEEDVDSYPYRPN